MRSFAWVVACVAVVCGWVTPRVMGQEKAPAAAEAKAPRAAVVTFGVHGLEKGKDESDGLVGIDITADSIRELIPLLKEERIGIVVIRVNCGGGLLAEIEKIAKVFHEEYKKEFRVVAWVDYAISAAAMSTHSIGEVYFTPKGFYGACSGTIGSGCINNSYFQRLETLMKPIAEWGGHDPKIMRAMMFSSELDECQPLGIKGTGALSATVDEATGKTEYFQDKTSGKVLLNPKGGVHILTFDAPTALAVRFSRGTAGTIEELAKAMKLVKVEWVGEKQDMIDWPVCKAERRNMELRAQFARKKVRCEREFNEYFDSRNALRAAEEGDRAARGEAATKKLNELAATVRETPGVAMLVLGMPDAETFNEWVQKQEKTIKDLRAGKK